MTEFVVKTSFLLVIILFLQAQALSTCILQRQLFMKLLMHSEYIASGILLAID